MSDPKSSFGENERKHICVSIISQFECERERERVAHTIDIHCRFYIENNKVMAVTAHGMQMCAEQA